MPQTRKPWLTHAHLAIHWLSSKTCVCYRTTSLTNRAFVIVLTGGSAIFDVRFRCRPQRFPRLFTPKLTDIERLEDLQMPSEIAHGPIIWRTAIGCAGYHDLWQVPAELHGSLDTISDSLMPGANSESDVPIILGKPLLDAAFKASPNLPKATKWPGCFDVNHAKGLDDQVQHNVFFSARQRQA